MNDTFQKLESFIRDNLYLKRQFVEYVTEYDKRRGTDFKKTFPQLIDFYDKYKN